METVVGKVGGDGEGVPGDDALVAAVHYADEAVGGGLGADALAGEVATDQVANELGGRRKGVRWGVREAEYNGLWVRWVVG